jgi:hypothetical protein
MTTMLDDASGEPTVGEAETDVGIEPPEPASEADEAPTDRGGGLAGSLPSDRRGDEVAERLVTAGGMTGDDAPALSAMPRDDWERGRPLAPADDADGVLAELGLRGRMLFEFPPARCWLTSWSISDTPGDGLRLCGLLPRLRN